MAASRTFIGIDGCRAGWFCVLLDDLDNWSFQVAKDSSVVGELAAHADSVLIDIPIGLVESAAGGRLCDREARRLLGSGRASSVFSAPARQTLAARSYQEALILNRQATGNGLSRQAWGIAPKIREIDVLLREHGSLHGRLRECHPELCFWALNGNQAMQFNKKKEPGQQERFIVLEQYFPQCHALFDQASGEYLRRQVARDDIIDAMVCAVTAKYRCRGYRTVPAKTQRDGQGLLMEMVY